MEVGVVEAGGVVEVGGVLVVVGVQAPVQAQMPGSFVTDSELNGKMGNELFMKLLKSITVGWPLLTKSAVASAKTSPELFALWTDMSHALTLPVASVATEKIIPLCWFDDVTVIPVGPTAVSLSVKLNPWGEIGVSGMLAASALESVNEPEICPMGVQELCPVEQTLKSFPV